MARQTDLGFKSSSALSGADATVSKFPIDFLSSGPRLKKRNRLHGFSTDGSLGLLAPGNMPNSESVLISALTKETYLFRLRMGLFNDIRAWFSTFSRFPCDQYLPRRTIFWYAFLVHSFVALHTIGKYYCRVADRIYTNLYSED